MPPCMIRSVLRTVLLLTVFGISLVAHVPARAAPWAGDRNRFASPRFEQLWRTADLAVQQGRTNRSWTWGPQPWFDYHEINKQSPNGLRRVQYFDKARMEINDPTDTSGPLEGVTSGLLVVELVSGRLKLGAGIGMDQNQVRRPSTTPVAGDLPALSGRSSITPGYASFRSVATIDNGYRDPNQMGQRVGTTFGTDGMTGFDQALADRPGTEIVAYDPVTGHNIPRVFNDFLEAGPLPAIVVAGHPITDAYWVRAIVAGAEQDVLVQLFERRTLTYTPANPPAFRVEMGNVGQHYFLWRYYGNPWAVADPQLPITFASRQDGGSLVYQTDAQARNLAAIGGSDIALVPSSQLGWWFPNLPPDYRVVYGDSTAYTGKRQLAILVPQAPFRERVLFSDAHDYAPAISPDGTQLAFVSDRDGNADLYLLVLDPDRAVEDRVAIRLTDTTDCANESPSWLPDGTGLVYASDCLGGNFALYRADLSYTLTANGQIQVSPLISPGTSQVTRLTNNAASDQWPRVSPDGSQIVFVSSRDGNNDIYTMRIDGRNPTRLTDHVASDEAPAWSQDGRQIVFNSNRDGDHEIFIMHDDGSHLVQVTDNAVDDGSAVWAP